MNGKCFAIVAYVSCALAATALGKGDKSSGVLSREALFEGCQYPEKREFPLSHGIGACQDFYAHVCTEAQTAFQLRADRSYHTLGGSDHEERLLYAKRRYLSLLTEREARSDRERMMQAVFRACLNEKASAQEERDYVEKITKQVQGLKSREDFKEYLQLRIDAAELSWVDFQSLPNQDNPRWNDLLLTGGVMTLPEKSYYADTTLLAEFTRVAERFFSVVGVADPAAVADRVVKLEAAYAAKQPVPAEIRKRLTARDEVRREKLFSLYPNLLLKRFVARVPEKIHVRNLVPESLTELDTLLASAPLADLKALYLWHELSDYLDDAYPEYFKQAFAFRHRFLGGPESRPPRDERCTQVVMGKFEREIDAELLPVLFPHLPKEPVEKMAEAVRASILRGLEANQWLSTVARAEAKKKISTAKLLLVSPQTDAQWDFTELAVYSEDKPIQNSQKYKTLRIKKELRELGEERDRSRWLMGPLTVNAYYISMDNVFVLPVGILQYPSFDPGASLAANLGGIGTTVGHELGHAIDDQGAQYDAEGKVRKWMTASDLKAFRNRGSRFIERFEKLSHDGKLTLGENIGDHVGLIFAFASLPTQTVESQREFFYSYARGWCTVMRPKFRELLLKSDPHAMAEARVNEQVKHLPAFAEVFGCKPADPMYLAPRQRIRVW